jgi:hypothetical protein
MFCRYASWIILYGFYAKKSFFDGAKLQAHNLSENNKRVYSVK